MAELIDRRILRHLRSAESILDVGCGDRRLVTFLACHTRKQVVGLDISSRRFATALQRQQTKWFVLGISLFLTLAFASVLLSALLPFYQQSGPAPEMLDTFSALFSVCIPLSIGVAILRYRLWDIDVVINQALIYGSLTATLAEVWAGSVVLINQATEEMFGSESATTAAVVSTVLVASVFQPLRGRIEEWINKRLYPEKFNLTKDFYEFTPQYARSDKHCGSIASDRSTRYRSDAQQTRRNPAR